jgi:cyclopropane-fatty-acyl-phospholipid synthase
MGSEAQNHAPQTSIADGNGLKGDARTRDKLVTKSIRFLNEITEAYDGPAFAIRFWDGSIWGDASRARFSLTLRNPHALAELFVSRDEVSAGEGYIYDDFDVEGDIESALSLADFLIGREFSVAQKLKFAGLMAALATEKRRGDVTQLRGKMHSRERDRKAVTYHYDVSNDFYALWLDRRMVYSCAYFKSPKDSLDTAQEQKLDYICKKLRLKPGEHLLDIGCGWGGLIMHAAKNYGVHATGITLSGPQAELAGKRISEAQLADRCSAEVCDYRDLKATARFEKIVSVGMFEHVGEAMLPDYFRRAWELLTPGGVFLNHGIAASATDKRQGPFFVTKYVFPDGELVPLNVTLRIAASCGFEVRDVESLREHYTMTLRHWVHRLEANADAAREVVGDCKYRIWRLYMAGAAHGFEIGRVNLYQVLLSKPERGHCHLPLTRADWYAI